MIERGFIFRHQQPHSEPRDGRYEYRIWPRAPHPAISILHGDWSRTVAERRADIYLLTPSSDRVLAKLRDGKRLEIKRLECRVGTVERWSMQLSVDFPLSSADRTEVAKALALPKPLPPVSSLTAAHLLAAIDGPVVTKTVRKSRLLFRLGACRAEVCRIAINDWTGLTIALEASDLVTIADAIDDLNLGMLPNRSYGEVLLPFVDLPSDHRRLPLTH